MVSKSKTQTQKFAIRLAKKFLKAKSYQLKAKVVALHGDLGALAQGILEAGAGVALGQVGK